MPLFIYKIRSIRLVSFINRHSIYLPNNAFCDELYPESSEESRTEDKDSKIPYI
jgi:hypothetical protein